MLSSSTFINKFIYLRKVFGNQPFRLLDIGAGNHSANKAKRYFPIVNTMVWTSEGITTTARTTLTR